MVFSQTLQTIKAFFNGQPSYVADPHTAVGLAAARRLAPQKYVDLTISLMDRRAHTHLFSTENVKQIVLSTAHPAKFSEAVSKALEGSPNFNFERDVLPAEFHGLLDKERNVIDVERPDIDLVKAVIEQFATV